MKKLIAMFGVAVLLTGCSASFNINQNPDETFDENYQGSPDIDLENAGLMDEETGSGEEVTDEMMDEETASGEVVTDEMIEEETGSGDVVVDEEQ